VAVRHGFVHAFVPCSVALFTCSCGVSAVELDVRRQAPDGWSALPDDSHRCPRCVDVPGEPRPNGPPGSLQGA